MIKIEREDNLHGVCMVMIDPLLYRGLTITNKTNCCNLATANFSYMSCLTFEKEYYFFLFK